MGIEVGLNTSKLRSTNRFGAVVVVLALAVAIALVGFTGSASAEERRSGSLSNFSKVIDRSRFSMYNAC